MLIEEALASQNQPRQRAESMFDVFIDYYHRHVADLSRPYPHVVDALARKKKKTPRKWKVEIRVLVDEPESVALLCFRGVPVARQTVPTQGEAKVAALSSVLEAMDAA